MSVDLRQIGIKLFGFPAENNGAVRLEVLGEKLAVVAKGLKASDRHQNKSKSLRFLITDAEIGSFKAQISESQENTTKQVLGSGIEYFYSCIRNVETQGRFPVGTPKKVAKAVLEVTEGVGNTFEIGHLEIDEDNVVNITPYLNERANAAYKERFETPEEGLFAGSEADVFDGVLKAVDLRDSTAKAWLILTGTSKQISCVWNNVDGDAFRNVLDKRARIEGDALYDGGGRLPSQLNIRRVLPLEERASNLSKWRDGFQFHDMDNLDEAW